MDDHDFLNLPQLEFIFLCKFIKGNCKKFSSANYLTTASKLGCAKKGVKLQREVGWAWVVKGPKPKLNVQETKSKKSLRSI